MSDESKKRQKDEQESTNDWSRNVLPAVIVIIIVALSLLSNWLFQYAKWWTLAINAAMVLLGLLVLTIINHRVKIKSLNSELGELSEVTTDLKEISDRMKASTNLLKYVANGAELMAIEGSVGDCGISNPKIYVQSSRFELETTNTQFALMLIENLRKGVQYRYLIPQYIVNPEEYDRFEAMVVGWWREYSSFLFNQEACNKIVSQGMNSHWQEEYRKNINTAKNYWGKKATKVAWRNLALKVYQSFSEQIIAYTADESQFYIVTAIYQVGIDSWKAIVKLPTDYLDDDINDYYSFVVFGEDQQKAENPFIKKFKANFHESSKYSMAGIKTKIMNEIEGLINEKY